MGSVALMVLCFVILEGLLLLPKPVDCIPQGPQWPGQKEIVHPRLLGRKVKELYEPAIKGGVNQKLVHQIQNLEQGFRPRKRKDRTKVRKPKADEIFLNRVKRRADPHHGGFLGQWGKELGLDGWKNKIASWAEKVNDWFASSSEEY
ncbi:unnamed protein product, partial [Cyprideis torosa]